MELITNNQPIKLGKTKIEIVAYRLLPILTRDVRTAENKFKPCKKIAKRGSLHISIGQSEYTTCVKQTLECLKTKYGNNKRTSQ